MFCYQSQAVIWRKIKPKPIRITQFSWLGRQSKQKISHKNFKDKNQSKEAICAYLYKFICSNWLVEISLLLP